MAFRGIKLLTVIKTANIIRHNILYSTSTSIVFSENESRNKPKVFRNEKQLQYLDDPDTFGTLSRVKPHNDMLEDEGDLKEEQYIRESPVLTQKLTTKQYADIIKQYLNHKRLKEAMNVLEVRMLKEDRVKPENYIYNILIGACADVGFTKKAFKLFNDMKRRGLKPTGDTYTCLFQACSNSPWPLDGLKHAKHLRELMIEKGVKPNLTNYNAMIKAFGRCGDLITAFQIVDEMVTQKIKIRVHTFNHLLQACISDKENGLRHAIFVWRKMLKLREKPNIYSFNLMLKCVKDCNFGNIDDIAELIYIIQEQTMLDKPKTNLLLMQNTSKIGNSKNNKMSFDENLELTDNGNDYEAKNHSTVAAVDSVSNYKEIIETLETDKEESLIKKDNVSIQFVNIIQESRNDRSVPNLLSKELSMQHVLALKDVHSVQDKFAVIGGQEDFLKEMDLYSVKPDVKTFTQMLPLLEGTEAENKLLDTMKSLGIKADIDFYNMLIKNRCFRSDYISAFEVKELIDKENKSRKRFHPLKKKLRLKANIMTYGVLALACKTREDAEKLLNEMKEEQLKVNIVILSALLRQGTAHNNFDYIMYILNVVKEENIPVNDIFLKHLTTFNEYCKTIVKQKRRSKENHGDDFIKSYKLFLQNYNTFLKHVNVEEILKSENPWQQFKDVYPETVQRQPIVIDEPKRFYKRNLKYVPYAPKK